MIYKSLGKSGLQISGISLGSWMTFGQSVDDATTHACMTRAYDAGVNFFDGAEVYGMGAAEEAMGRVFTKTGWPRDTYILSSKVTRIGSRPTQTGICRKRLREACEAAMRRLGTDYLDLYFCHRPDGKTPVEEIVLTMNHLIEQGKILYWGTSEFHPADLFQMHAFAERHGLEGPLVEQTGYNLLGRERIDEALKPLFQRFGMGSTVYSPLAGGILTGKYNHGIPSESRIGSTKQEWLKKSLTEERLEKSRRLASIAQQIGITQAHLALAWVLKHPHVSTAIIGATRPEQIEENVAAVEAMSQLSEPVMAQIAECLAS